MVSPQTLSIAERAKSLFDHQLRAELESKHTDRFVAIEPDSGDYFLGSTFSESVMAAHASYPERISFVIRVGHEAAIHMGGSTTANYH